MDQSAADAKDAATLVELRDKLDVAASHLAMVQAQQRRTAVGLRRAQLTLEELGALPDDAATYRAVGKAYFLAPKGELVSELDADAKAARDQSTELEKQRQRAEKALEDLDAEVAEVARGNPRAAAAFRRLIGGGGGGGGA